MEDGNVSGQKQKPFKPHVTPQGRGMKRGRAGGRGGKEEDNRKITAKGRIISTEDIQTEVAINPEAEVEEVIMTEVLTREKIE